MKSPPSCHHAEAAASKKKAVPKKRAAKKRAAKAAPKKKHRKSKTTRTGAGVGSSTNVTSADSNDGDNTQPEQLVASSPPLVDLLNIDDFFKMRLASFLKEMTVEEYRNFCLQVVAGCDTYVMNDGKLSYGFSKYDQDPCSFLKKLQKKSKAFMEVVRNHCKPLHAILTILQPHLLCVFPLVIRGELRMHADKPTAYGIPVNHIKERWCIYFFDKIMKLQQKGNPDNYVVINCSDGDAFCMNDKGRGIDHFPGGVTVQHGCPKKLMKGVGSELSITIVVDVSFEDEDTKVKALGQLFSRFASAVPSDSNSNSIQSLKDVAAATTAVATRPSFLLDDIDPDGSVKDAIDAKAALLLTTCVTFNCNQKAIGGTRHCKVCSNRIKECCVDDCMVNRHSHERNCVYCLHHRDPKTRCRKCKRRGLVEGSEIKLCSTCNLLCRKTGCEKAFVDGVTKLCSTCLVEAKSIAKEKVLEREARCRTRNLMKPAPTYEQIQQLQRRKYSARKYRPAPTYEQIQQEIARHQAKVKKALEKPFWKTGG